MNHPATSATRGHHTYRHQTDIRGPPRAPDSGTGQLLGVPELHQLGAAAAPEGGRCRPERQLAAARHHCTATIRGLSQTEAITDNTGSQSFPADSSGGDRRTRWTGDAAARGPAAPGQPADDRCAGCRDNAATPAILRTTRAMDPARHRAAGRIRDWGSVAAT